MLHFSRFLCSRFREPSLSGCSFYPWPKLSLYETFQDDKVGTALTKIIPEIKDNPLRFRMIVPPPSLVTPGQGWTSWRCGASNAGSPRRMGPRYLPLSSLAGCHCQLSLGSPLFFLPLAHAHSVSAFSRAYVSLVQGLVSPFVSSWLQPANFQLLLASPTCMNCLPATPPAKALTVPSDSKKREHQVMKEYWVESQATCVWFCAHLSLSGYSCMSPLFFCVPCPQCIRCGACRL